MTIKPYYLQALQIDGIWYTLSEHATWLEANIAMRQRGSWRRMSVKYRII